MAEDGSLAFIDLTSARGVHWLATVSDRFMIVAEDPSDPGPGQLEAFKIDSDTGGLTSFSIAPFNWAANAITVDESASLVYIGTDDGIYGYAISEAGFSALPGSPYGVTPPDLPSVFTEDVLITPFSPFLYTAYAGYRASGGFDVIQRDSNGALTTGKAAGGDTTLSVAAFANGKFVYFSDDGLVFGARVDDFGMPTQMPGTEPPDADTIANDPTGRFLFGIIQGFNVVTVSSIDSETGMPTQVAGSPFSSQGTGTSIVRIDPQNKFVFVANGSNVGPTPSNTIALFSLNNSTGVLTPVPGSPFASHGSLPTDVAVVH